MRCYNPICSKLSELFLLRAALSMGLTALLHLWYLGCLSWVLIVDIPVEKAVSLT